MESLAKTLYSNLSNAVSQFIEKAAVQLSVDKQQLISIWNESVTEEVKIVEKKTVVKKPKEQSSESSDEKKTCEYLFKKGKSEGTLCGSKVSDESVTGLYCKKHLGQENAKEEKKDSNTKKMQIKKPKTEAKEEDTPVIDNLKQSPPVFTVKLNQYRRYVHEGTGLLFDRNTEEVYGREKGNGEVLSLTVEDIELAKSNGWKYRIPEQLKNAPKADGKKNDEDDEEVDEEEQDELDNDEDEDEDEEEDEEDEEEEILSDPGST